MEAHAQSSWADIAKNAVAATWESTQRVFIYDDRPVQSFAEPLRQQIRHRVGEENQRFHGANEAAIQRRQNGHSCRAIGTVGIHSLLEKKFNDKCYVEEIRKNCKMAVDTAQSFDSNHMLLRSSGVQGRVTLEKLKAVHKGMIKKLNSIIEAREGCYRQLSKPLVDGYEGECKQSLEATLYEYSEQVAAFCTENDFDDEINAFIYKMRQPEGSAHIIYIAKEQYIQVRKIELQMAQLLLSLTDAIQSRLTHERSTASSEISQQQ